MKHAGSVRGGVDHDQEPNGSSGLRLVEPNSRPWFDRPLRWLPFDEQADLLRGYLGQMVPRLPDRVPDINLAEVEHGTYPMLSINLDWHHLATALRLRLLDLKNGIRLCVSNSLEKHGTRVALHCDVHDLLEHGCCSAESKRVCARYSNVDTSNLAGEAIREGLGHYPRPVASEGLLLPFYDPTILVDMVNGDRPPLVLGGYRVLTPRADGWTSTLVLTCDDAGVARLDAVPVHQVNEEACAPTYTLL